MEVPSCLGKDRPSKSWSESLREDLKTKRLNPEMLGTGELTYNEIAFNE